MMSLLLLGCFAALTVPPALAQQCNLLLSLDARHYQQGSDTWAASPGTSVAGTINRDVGSITFDANEGALRFSGAAVVTAPVNINPGPNPELTIEIVLKPANSMNYARTNA